MRFLRPLARFWTVILGCTVLALTLAVVARSLVPLTPWVTAPSLLATDPPDGAVDVLPHTAITLRFSGPMNRASAAAALRIDPPSLGSLSWSPDATSLTFQPTVALTPAVTYTISLDGAALGRWWKPLAAPVTVRFRTAPQPAVVAALPMATNAPTDTPLAVVFSQPMVAPGAVGLPTALPEIRLDPPIPLSARWADQNTLLLVPTSPLALATRYSATISATLTDLRGVELGAPFSWSFATAWPAVIGREPKDGARWVSPHTALSLRLAEPLDPALLRQSLRITPTVEGDLTAELIGVTQVVTFTPRAAWAYGTTYSVTLVAPSGSGLGAPPPLTWQFSVEPAPRLVAFFPGQGQTLLPGETIRLVFSTPMDEAALRAGLTLAPHVGDLPISVNETEVRLLPTLRPSTRYTITLAADTHDRSGEPLGAATAVSLLTAPALPALTTPDAFAGLVSLPVSRTATVALNTVGLSALELRLYPLDAPTLLRALALRPDEWATFSPERYGQRLARSWRVSLGTPSDQPSRLALPVGLADGAGLPAGAYYLRVIAPEGPRADLMLIASEARLALRQGTGYALVWATDTAGVPLAGLPVSLYSGGVPVARGQTAPDGTWVQRLSRSPGDPPLLAVADGDAPAVVRGDWQIGTPPVAVPVSRSLLFADHAHYAPGELVQVRGLARRQTADGTLALPADGTPCRLQLRGIDDDSGPATDCQLEATTGAISGTLALGPRLNAGDYRLVAQVGDERLAMPIHIVTPDPASFGLTASAVGQRELLLQVSRGGLPLGGAVVNWSLRLDPLAAPPPPTGFTLAPPPPAAALTLAGQTPADAAGRVRIGIPEQPGDPVARSYSLAVSLGDSTATAQGTLLAGATVVALRLPTRLVASDQRSSIELLALDGLGRPAPNTKITVEVFHTGTTGGPVLIRHSVAGPDGLAAAQLVQLRPGAYDLVATAGGPPTSVRLWVYAATFAGWPASTSHIELVADRDRYRPGEVARLLVAAPETSGNLLLTVERGDLLNAEVRPVRAGQVITVPITADMAPGVSVGVIVDTGTLRRIGTTALTVASSPTPLEVRVEAGQPEVPPGASVPVTVTTSDGSTPLTNLLVTIAPEQASSGAALDRLTPGPPAASLVAAMPTGGLVGAAGAPATNPVAQPLGYSVPLEITPSATGIVTGQLRLPNASGRWRVSAFAASGPDRVAAGSTVITTSLPLTYTLIAPTVLRPGDRAAFSLNIGNSGVTTREVRLTLAANGLHFTTPTTPAQRLTLAPGEATKLHWEAEPADGATTARLNVTLETPDLHEELTRDLLIAPRTMAGSASSTLVASGNLHTNLSLGTGTGDITMAVAPGLRAALTDQAVALAAMNNPSVEELAALTVIAAGLAHDVPGAEGARWQRAGLTALVALDAAQNADGGWGWWPGAPSRPCVSAFALEAQATARTVFGATHQPSAQAITYLSRVAPAANPDTRAYSAYVLAQIGREPDEIARLADSLRNGPLEADGLAYLAMAVPLGQSGPLLDRLQALAIHEAVPTGGSAPINWRAPALSELPRGLAAVTAAASQALAARRPSAPELPGAETALLATWGVNGWPTAYDAARVALALLAHAPAAGDGPSEVRLNGATIIGGAMPLTGIRRVTVPTAGLPAHPDLVVATHGPATYMLSYGFAAVPNTPATRLTLWQELIDPTSGAALDPTRLRLGQLVALRITAVVARPLLRADLAIALPAGLEPVNVTPRAPFAHVTVSPDMALVRLRGADLAPGVYTQQIVARAAATGHFTAPAARLIAPYEPEVVTSAPGAVRVTIGA